MRKIATPGANEAVDDEARRKLEDLESRLETKTSNLGCGLFLTMAVLGYWLMTLTDEVKQIKQRLGPNQSAQTTTRTTSGAPEPATKATRGATQP